GRWIPPREPAPSLPAGLPRCGGARPALPCADRWRCRRGDGRPLGGAGRAPAGGGWQRAGLPRRSPAPSAAAAVTTIIINNNYYYCFHSPSAIAGGNPRSSGASVVAIDNKIEQAMDLVKSHLMYAVREEVEVLKEQIKELIEKNSQLEQENTLLKTLASPEQLAQFQAQLQTGSPPSSSQSQGTTQQPAQPASQGSGPSA
uniref:TSC22 domain family protein 1 n=1 Tax=Falco tinnunculus TaxID=100819 RepID=A0A8C4U3X3_FALTI